MYEHIKSFDADLSLYFCESFVTILLRYSSVSLQKRILDLFLLEGEKLIYDIILRILELNRPEILAKNTLEEMVQFLKKDLMEHSFNMNKEKLQKIFPMP